jgi:ubiquinone/menaquinone biosynthesis C-methylase UbiE
MENIKSWVDYWNNPSYYKKTDFLKTASIFARETKKIFNYSLNDVVLDIGCGEGEFLRLISGSVAEAHGTDTSDAYLDLCRKKFGGKDNIFLHKIPGSYTDFSFFGEKKFTIITCLSTIQYYKNEEEVEVLIKNVAKIAALGARFLIADIPSGGGMASDVLGVLKVAAKERYLGELLRYLFWARFSEYYKVRKKLGLLVLSPDRMLEIVDRLGLAAELLSAPLSTNSNRKHLLIQF